MRKTDHSNSSRGFTIVELLVVVSIIGILSGIGVWSFARQRDRAKVAATVSELRSIESALHAYYASNEEFPPNATEGTMPTGLEPFLADNLFSEQTPIGGRYDWEGPDQWDTAAISVRGASRNDLVELVDQYLDDGNLSTGRFRRTDAGAPALVIE